MLKILCLTIMKRRLWVVVWFQSFFDFGFQRLSLDKRVWEEGAAVVVGSSKEVLGTVVALTLRDRDLEYFESKSRMSWPRMMMTTRSMKMPTSITPHRNTGKHLGSASSLCLYRSAGSRCSDGSIDFWSRLKLTRFLAWNKNKLIHWLLR